MKKKIHSGFFLDFIRRERLLSHGQNVFSGTTHIFAMNERRRYDAMYGILFISDDNIYRTPNVLYSTKAIDKVTIFPFLVWIGVAVENLIRFHKWNLYWFCGATENQMRMLNKNFSRIQFNGLISIFILLPMKWQINLIRMRKAKKNGRRENRRKY